MIAVERMTPEEARRERRRHERAFRKMRARHLEFLNADTTTAPPSELAEARKFLNVVSAYIRALHREMRAVRVATHAPEEMEIDQ